MLIATMKINIYQNRYEGGVIGKTYNSHRTGPSGWSDWQDLQFSQNWPMRVERLARLTIITELAHEGGVNGKTYNSHRTGP